MNRQRGFSMLELVLVVILVVTLYVVAMDRIMPLRGDAEAAAAATVVGSLRSALGLEVAARLVDNGPAAVVSLDGANPMHFLAEVPENYVGEVSGLRPEQIPPGNWYFDQATRELVYLVKYPEYFRTELAGAPRLVFRTELVYNEREELAGVRLGRLNAFVWTQSPAAAELLGIGR